MKPKDIAIVLTNILKQITTANGYNTDIGHRVFRGRLKLDDDKIPCVVIGEEDDQVTDRVNYGKNVSITQGFVIDAYVRCDPDNPNDAAHDVIEDLKKALFTGQSNANPAGALAPHVRTLKYIRRHIGPRPEGADFVLGSITIETAYVETLT